MSAIEIRGYAQESDLDRLKKGFNNKIEEVLNPLIKRHLQSLLNLEKTVKILDTLKEEDIDKLQITFKSDDSENSYPFFYLLNGPIADSFTHVGQIISFRRSSGNPIPKGVTVFMGVKN